MNLLLIGRNGQVGWELQRALATFGNVVALDYPEIDLANEENVRGWVRRISPQVIINAAAFTAVDQAESESELAMAINGTAPGILAEELKSLEGLLIHYSSDYVFDGTKGEPYTEQDKPNPLNVYGLSKLVGDQNVQQVDGDHLILRTTWVYSMRRGGFVRKVLEWARKNPTLRIVSDQVGSPTWARALAEITAQVLAMTNSHPAGWLSDRKGLYHLGGQGCVSRLVWAQKILEFDPFPDEQIVQEIDSALTNEFATAATRPLYSGVDCSLFVKTFGLSLPDWEHSLQMAMEPLQ